MRRSLGGSKPTTTKFLHLLTSLNCILHHKINFSCLILTSSKLTALFTPRLKTKQNNLLTRAHCRKASNSPITCHMPHLPENVRFSGTYRRFSDNGGRFSAVKIPMPPRLRLYTVNTYPTQEFLFLIMAICTSSVRWFNI